MLVQHVARICDTEAHGYFSRSAGVDFSCPVEPGTYNVSHTVELPLRILPGRAVSGDFSRYSLTLWLALYTIKVLGYTVDDYDLTCLDIWVDFWST